MADLSEQQQARRMAPARWRSSLRSSRRLQLAPYDATAQRGAGTLGISPTFTGRTAVLTVSGDLDMATAPQLHRALGDIAGEGFEIVTLDLGGVGFIDSSGLQALVTAYERQLGDRLRILPCKRLVRLLDMTGTHGRLPVLAA